MKVTVLPSRPCCRLSKTRPNRADPELPTNEPAAVTPMDVPKRLAVGGIRLYQWTLSPWLGRQCRFYPTCSQYAAQAIETHGALRGTLLSLKRLGRCHPFHAGGVDLVPPPRAPARKES